MPLGDNKFNKFAYLSESKLLQNYMATQGIKPDDKGTHKVVGFSKIEYSKIV